MKSMSKLTSIAAFLILAASPLTEAVDLTTYKCTYDKYSDGEQIKATDEIFSLIFVTDKKGEATLVGNNGSSKVMGFWNQSGQGVSFVEVTPIGNIMTTVIDSAKKSVHSRHTLVDGHVVPSQYYSECVVQ